MRVLVAGFSAAAADRLTDALRQAGHQVLAAGREQAMALAGGFGPAAVVVPAGEGGDGLRAGWPGDVAPVVHDADPSGDAPPAALLSGSAALVVAARPPQGPPSEPAHAPAAVEAPPRRPPARRERREHDAAPGGSDGAPNIASKLAQVRFSDYHCILEVESGASEYVIRDKHEHLSRVYSPAGWPGTLTPEDVEGLEEIGRGIRDAWDILSDPVLRARYERAIADGAGAPRR